MKKISMIGLGKLGLPTATFFAFRGCTVVGVDSNPHLIEQLSKGIVESEEPELRELFAQTHKHFMSFTTSIHDAVLQTDMTFIIVPTPSNPDGSFSNRYVREVAETIGKALREKQERHLVILVSTVMPGSTERDLLKVIENFSGKNCPKDFGVCHCPEFVAIGDVLKHVAAPDFVLIGASDVHSAELLEKFYDKILPNQRPVRKMNLENAELAKIALNTYVTTKISYANMLAEICERGGTLDLDAEVITKAIGLDARIGQRYLSPGLGYGGPCFPRDNKALVAFADSIGSAALLAEATDEINDGFVQHTVERLIRLRPEVKDVSIIGVSYKPNTDVIEQSQGILLGWGFYDFNRNVKIFDHPAALKNAKDEFGKKCTYAESLNDAVKDVQIIVLAVPDHRLIPDFNNVENVIIFDPWKIVPNYVTKRDDITYVTVGKK